MSLRDQLLAKGLVSKKRAKSLDRQSKQERKKSQANRKKKKVLDAERNATLSAAEADRVERVRKARLAAKQAQTVLDAQARIRSVILGNRIPGRGRVPYFHRGLDGRTVYKMSLPEPIAGWLRSGRAAVVALQHRGQEPEYVVVNASAARELLQTAPHLVLTFVQETSGISEAEEAFLVVDWEPSLSAHRVAPSASPCTESTG
ncbi:MAG: DUF2058 family protein [Myxococcota bacterium]